MRTASCACPVFQPVTGRVVCTGVGAGAAGGGGAGVVWLGDPVVGAGDVGDAGGDDEDGGGEEVVGGGDVGGVAGQDTQNTLCLAAALFWPANVQNSL